MAKGEFHLPSPDAPGPVRAPGVDAYRPNGTSLDADLAKGLPTAGPKDTFRGQVWNLVPEPHPSTATAPEPTRTSILPQIVGKDRTFRPDPYHEDAPQHAPHTTEPVMDDTAIDAMVANIDAAKYTGPFPRSTRAGEKIVSGIADGVVNLAANVVESDTVASVKQTGKDAAQLARDTVALKTPEGRAKARAAFTGMMREIAEDAKADYEKVMGVKNDVGEREGGIVENVAKKTAAGATRAWQDFAGPDTTQIVKIQDGDELVDIELPRKNMLKTYGEHMKEGTGGARSTTAAAVVSALAITGALWGLEATAPKDEAKASASSDTVSVAPVVPGPAQNGEIQIPCENDGMGNHELICNTPSGDKLAVATNTNSFRDPNGDGLGETAVSGSSMKKTHARVHGTADLHQGETGGFPITDADGHDTGTTLFVTQNGKGADKQITGYTASKPAAGAVG